MEHTGDGGRTTSECSLVLSARDGQTLCPHSDTRRSIPPPFPAEAEERDEQPSRARVTLPPFPDYAHVSRRRLRAHLLDCH